ncbi:MAG: RNA polymerase sigma factor [Anaerolineae bacterium]
MLDPTVFTEHGTPTTQADEWLAVRAAHDPDAFSELYRRYLTRVYRYLLAHVGGEQDAQDLTAQTFLDALENIHRYQGRGVFAAWLLSIARHKAADFYRRNRIILPLEDAESAPHPEMSPEAQVEQQMQMEQVARALRQISPERAEVLMLRVFGGLSGAEAAQVLGKSEDAVHALYSRALRDLRQRLTG